MPKTTARLFLRAGLRFAIAFIYTSSQLCDPELTADEILCAARCTFAGKLRHSLFGCHRREPGFDLNVAASARAGAAHQAGFTRADHLSPAPHRPRS